MKKKRFLGTNGLVYEKKLVGVLKHCHLFFLQQPFSCPSALLALSFFGERKNIPVTLKITKATVKTALFFFANRIVFPVFTFTAIHALFWSLEHVYFQWCVSNFFYSMFSSQTQVCYLMREVSTQLRQTNVTLLSVAVPLAVIGVGNLLQCFKAEAETQTDEKTR